jgi:hypothetical protein
VEEEQTFAFFKAVLPQEEEAVNGQRIYYD